MWRQFSEQIISTWPRSWTHHKAPAAPPLSPQRFQIGPVTLKQAENNADRSFRRWRGVTCCTWPGVTSRPSVVVVTFMLSALVPTCSAVLPRKLAELPIGPRWRHAPDECSLLPPPPPPPGPGSLPGSMSSCVLGRKKNRVVGVGGCLGGGGHLSFLSGPLTNEMGLSHFFLFLFRALERIRAALCRAAFTSWSQSDTCERQQVRTEKSWRAGTKME